jgi:hypothetical protein
MKKLLLLFLFGTMAYAQPNINPPIDITVCQNSPGGVATFNLTINNTVMLVALNPSLYSIKYYDTAVQAEVGGADNISNANNFVSMNNDVIYVRVTEIANPTNYTVASFELIVAPVPTMVDLPAIMQCESPFDLTANSNLIDNSYTVTYYSALADAEMGANPIASPQSYVSETSSTVWARISIDSSPCYLIVEQELVIYADALQVSILFDGAQNVTITTTMEADYQYSMDEGPWQDSPAFTDLAYGMHIAKVQDPCGNIVTMTFFVTPPPTGETLYGYMFGDTLANIPVEGENIQWYATETSDTPLPMTTELTNETTYYATQTIDNQESAARLAVQVYSIIMGSESNTFTTLSYYPNPASGILTIENAKNGIDSVSVANTLGQTVLTKTINSSSAQVDVSSLTKGIYFVTVTSGSATKTVKIIKE